MPRSGSRVRVSFAALCHSEIHNMEVYFQHHAQVAELVDAHVSGACVLRRAGSSPVLGTMFSECQKYVGEVAELVDALL